MKLMDIALSLEAIEEIDPGTPEEKEFLKQTVDTLEYELDKKVDAIVCTIKGLEGEAGVVADEVKRLQDRKRSMENRAKSIREFLKYFMSYSKIDKIKTAFYSVNKRKGNPSVTIMDAGKIPEECYKNEIVFDYEKIVEGMKMKKIKLPKECYSFNRVLDMDEVEKLVAGGWLESDVAVITVPEILTIR